MGEVTVNKDSLSITDNRTGKMYEIPIEHETIRALDLRQIKRQPDDFGLMVYDPAFTNTASTKSTITYIDGEKGILRYRGYPIEELAEKSTFLEVAYLLIFGELPARDQLTEWKAEILENTSNTLWFCAAHELLDRGQRRLIGELLSHGAHLLVSEVAYHSQENALTELLGDNCRSGFLGLWARQNDHPVVGKHLLRRDRLVAVEKPELVTDFFPCSRSWYYRCG